jgi:hypothetical protein
MTIIERVSAVGFVCGKYWVRISAYSGIVP